MTYLNPHLPWMKRLKKGGFTLVETMLSAGIVASVLLSISALIPIALDVQAEAIRTNTQTRIVQAFTGEIQLCDWGDIDTVYNTEAERTREFDDQGTLLPTGSPDAIYSARVYLLPAHGGATLSPVNLPGDDSAAPGSTSPITVDRPEHLRRIAIHITAIPAPLGPTLLDTPSDERVQTFTTSIVNLRKR